MFASSEVFWRIGIISFQVFGQFIIIIEKISKLKLDFEIVIFLKYTLFIKKKYIYIYIIYFIFLLQLFK